MTDPDNTNALTAIIKALTPLDSAERHRTVDAAMMFLGEAGKKSSIERNRNGGEETDESTPEGSYLPAVTKWMNKYGVSPEELDHVLHFSDDGSFEILDVPGKSKKDRTMNTYILTGLGKYLTTNERAFDDVLARKFCDTIGCYDPANHSTHLKNKGHEFSGDKNKGYALTNEGIKRAAALVKEVAGAAK